MIDLTTKDTKNHEKNLGFQPQTSPDKKRRGLFTENRGENLIKWFGVGKFGVRSKLMIGGLGN